MIQSGSCLCSGVTYEVDGPLRDVINCHCIRCRRHTGHFMAATSSDVSDVAISGATLRWYNATPDVQYGFCATCGSTLFWRATDKPDRVSIAAGTIDPPTELRTTAALFVDDASDYHALDKSLDQFHRDY